MLLPPTKPNMVYTCMKKVNKKNTRKQHAPAREWAEKHNMLERMFDCFSSETMVTDGNRGNRLIAAAL
jgi:hypothetical protein